MKESVLREVEKYLDGVYERTFSQNAYIQSSTSKLRRSKYNCSYSLNDEGKVQTIYWWLGYVDAGQFKNDLRFLVLQNRLRRYGYDLQLDFPIKCLLIRIRL